MLKIVIIILSLCYPFMVYWGLQHYDTRILLSMLLVLICLRWFSGGETFERKIVLATLIGVAIVASIWGHQLGLKIYPVMVNFGFLILFGGSLIFSPTIVERMARIQVPDLSIDAVAYTRKVTWVWSVFFLFNGAIATYTTLFSSERVWMIYNGFIAYLLIGILTGGEWIIRRRIKRD